MGGWHRRGGDRGRRGCGSLLRCAARRLGAVSFLSLVGATACQPVTQVVLAVFTDLPIPAGLDQIDLSVSRPRTGNDPWTSGPQHLASDDAQPVTLGLTPAGGTATIKVVAVGSLAGNPIVQQELDTSFVEGQSRLLQMILRGVCAGVSCGDGLTCVDGACTKTQISSASLPAWTGQLPGPPPISPGGRSLWAAGNHSCAIVNDALHCWGQNTDGELGCGNAQVQHTAVPVAGIVGPTAVGLGTAHSCACDSTGQAFCWGQNTSGQLGIGTLAGQHVRPVAVPGITDCLQITGGGAHTCVLHRTDSSVSCWGSNVKGQLGLGTTGATPQPTPQPVNLPDVVELDAGANYTCARIKDGSVWCWGENVNGQLGDGTNVDKAVPTPVTGLSPSGVVELAASPQFMCVRYPGGQMSCWGDNSGGQLGTGNKKSTNTPVDVLGVTDARQIAAGGLQHTCIVRMVGTVSCWGANANGQLGNGTTVPSLTPVDVMGGVAGVTTLAAGNNYTCAQLASSVACWGQDSLSQLGEGDQMPMDRVTAVTVVF
jgi:alpha-tubulin suppressor-like RCC1 family protein